jgi:hypothetical protein
MEHVDMGAEFFTFNRIPDLTLAQYSAEESGGVDDVIKQHQSFYRQIGRKGMLFGEVFHLIVIYDPEMPSGRRLNIFFRVDSESMPVCME